MILSRLNPLNALMIVCIALAATAVFGILDSSGYIGEPKGVLVLSIGFGLILSRARKQSSECIVIDIANRFEPNSDSDAGLKTAGGDLEEEESERRLAA